MHLKSLGCWRPKVAIRSFDCLLRNLELWNHGRSQPTYTGPDGQAILTIKANVWEEMRFVTTMVFKTISTEPIVLLLGIYNGFAYAILFLYLDGVFRVFVVNNGLSIISANLTYPTFAAGVSMMFAFVPVQNWLYARDRTRHGHNHPGARCSGFGMLSYLHHQ
ncbi:uncharacterized protein L3040_003169 [Drepanopeziza brunnea f. sp. 'multigermtubi']|uniref:uncharacterized protein n=1 Tax=Drepanopeziza brunnea f. sp. 'multigermtubi' TaxID=698441 RepID=UPI00238B1438|nr:hypothetical protein L3040_003169 [Drepanopeziza brunnea f. sp. 'multigermtubi']